MVYCGIYVLVLHFYSAINILSEIYRAFLDCCDLESVVHKPTKNGFGEGAKVLSWLFEPSGSYHHLFKFLLLLR